MKNPFEKFSLEQQKEIQADRDEYEKSNEEYAERKNERRSLRDKIFRRNKKSAIEYMHSDALSEDKERADEKNINEENKEIFTTAENLADSYDSDIGRLPNMDPKDHEYSRIIDHRLPTMESKIEEAINELESRELNEYEKNKLQNIKNTYGWAKNNYRY